VLLHFAGDHGLDSGDYSIRHGIRGPDWDVAELDPGTPS
jgi:hypothetical protein